MPRALIAFFRGARSLLARPGSAIGLWLTLLFLLLAVLGPALAPHGPTATTSEARVAPSVAHLFGTDHLGRDVLSRVLYGTRSVISLAGLGTLIAVAAGLLVGMASGYRGGLFDEVLMRVFDSLLAIPALLLALLLVGTIGPSRQAVLIILPVLYTPIVARVVRSEMLRIRERGFVAAARLRGESTLYLLFREIFPSLLPALSVEAALRFSYAIFLVASLGFLGVGVQPPTPDWGLMVNEARSFVRLTPWAMVFPAAAISLLVVGVNLLADGLRCMLLRTDDASEGYRPTADGRRRPPAANTAAAAGARAVVVPGAGVAPILELERVTVSYHHGTARHDALREVSLRLEAGQTYGLVGESGSGKSTLAMATMAHLPDNATVSGRLAFAGMQLGELPPEEVGRVRGSRVSLVPQDPLSSLNPAHRIGRQLVEALGRHGVRGAPPPEGSELRGAAMRLLAEVGIGDAERVARAYPHQLSGGMQQRVMIAMALSTEPELLVLDEPTTGLDVTTEAVVLDLIANLIRRHQTSALYISHDLGVVAGVADRVAVLYAGELVEDGATARLFAQPLHPYTRGLLDSVPQIGTFKGDASLTSMQGQIPRPGAPPPGCVFAPRCPLAEQRCHDARPDLERANPDRSADAPHHVRCHRWQEIAAGEAAVSYAVEQPIPAEQPKHARATRPGVVAPRLETDELRVGFAVPRRLSEVLRGEPRRRIQALDGASLAVAAGHTLGLVGESGSGKSTLANAVLGLVATGSVALEGRVTLGGQALSPRLASRSLAQLRALQLVAQNPYEALNPYLTVGEALQRPLRRLGGLTAAAARVRVAELLDDVGLDAGYRRRLPAQLSGGERQRVAIARAIAADTMVVLCDEPTSALDVSVQARIVELINRLQRERGTSYLFISHDLSLVGFVADWIAVVYLGHVVEAGPREEALRAPQHPYTEALLAAVPSVAAALGERAAPVRLSGEVPSPTERPTGCAFHTRCPRFLGEQCVREAPPVQQGVDGHRIACHIPLAELARLQQRAAPVASPTSGDSN